MRSKVKRPAFPELRTDTYLDAGNSERVERRALIQEQQIENPGRFC
jgi:hypothetical protein